MKKKLSKLKVSVRLLKKKMRRKKKNLTPKNCLFCGARQPIMIDYKNSTMLKNFLTERGKISPARISGVCASHQRELSGSIKKARTMALVPYLSCNF